MPWRTGQDGEVSTKVDLDELPAEIAARGPAAFLATNGPERPHLVSVAVTQQGAQLVVPAGRNTARNATANPAVTLLWPFDAEHPENSLLVDGIATLGTDGDQLTIEVIGAVLHRAGGRGPGC